MTSVLYSYLLQHKSLSIPGMGTIFIERVPAQSDFVNKQLLPPSYHYRFDKYFDSPEKDFFSYLALQKNIADYEAILKYNEWAFDLRNQIRLDSPVSWEKLGVFRRGLSGEIEFEAERAVPTYWEPVPAQRVIRSQSKHTVLVGDREFSNQQAAEFLHEEPVREKESWWMYALVLVAVSLIILFFHFYKYGFSTEAVGNQQNLQVFP